MFTATIGTNEFVEVLIPILWGTRAIYEGSRPGTLHVTDLSAVPVRREIVDSRPNKGIKFQPRLDGYGVKADGAVQYTFDPTRLVLRDVAGSLPELEVSDSFVRIDTNHVSGCRVSNFEVGILIDSDGVAIGAPLPLRTSTGHSLIRP